MPQPKIRTKRHELLLTEEEQQAIAEYAEREGISRNAAICRAIRLMLNIPRPVKRNGRAAADRTE